MKFTIRNRAPEHSRYTQGSCDKNIGKDLPFRLFDGEELMMGRVIDAKILDDGQVLEVTFEVSDEEHEKVLGRKRQQFDSEHPFA